MQVSLWTDPFVAIEPIAYVNKKINVVAPREWALNTCELSLLSSSLCVKEALCSGQFT